MTWSIKGLHLLLFGWTNIIIHCKLVSWMQPTTAGCLEHTDINKFWVSSLEFFGRPSLQPPSVDASLWFFPLSIVFCLWKLKSCHVMMRWESRGVRFRIFWGVFTLCFGHTYISHFKSIAMVFQYHRFPQTLLKVAYFILDFSSSAWRDFTLMSAWTASASCKNLWESRETNGATPVIMRMFLFFLKAVVFMCDLPLFCFDSDSFLFYPIHFQLLNFSIFLLS